MLKKDMVLSGNSWCTGHSAHVIRVPQNSRRFFTKIIRQFNQLSVNLSIVYEVPLTALTRIPLRGSLSICRAWTMDSAVNPILDTRYAAKTTKFSERCPHTVHVIASKCLSTTYSKIIWAIPLIWEQKYSWHRFPVEITVTVTIHVVWAWLCLSHASYYSNIRLLISDYSVYLCLFVCLFVLFIYLNTCSFPVWFFACR